ncbi:hypothetical protein, partial [Serratia marcescens]|uniref:hypothetical protein n=1 Tax=Serratia marcescens TaxID=615 RepID=UPI003C6FE4AC
DNLSSIALAMGSGNKLHNIEAICGDINEVSKNLNKMYDRIIMNLPGLAYEFLDLAMTLTLE